MSSNIEISKHSGVYQLKTVQFLPLSLKYAWSFFSNPENLENITPEQMGFKITSNTYGKTYPGQIITYKVKIFPFIKSNWVTEITHVEKEAFFVDEQRYGPYSMWHHEHHFESSDHGVKMTDIVTYKMPFGFLGNLAHALFVKKRLSKIFGFRRQTLSNLFQKD